MRSLKVIALQNLDLINNILQNIGFDWDNLRGSEPPMKPVVVSETDVSNFIKESKILTEEEKINPFNERAKRKVDLLTVQLDLKNFQMKRRDLLFQANLNIYEKFTKEAKELKKDE